jgi:hypothetical protein
MTSTLLALVLQAGGKAPPNTVPVGVAVLVALVTPIVSIVVAWITSTATNKREALRQRHERDLQEQKLRTDLRTEFMAEEAMKQLLQTPEWELRSYGEIKKRIGGFEGNDLRKLLVRSGAIRFYKKGLPHTEENELWGLRERNRDELEKDEDES